MITVLCFGNEFVKEDALAKKIVDQIKLKNIKFVKCINNEDILKYSKKNIVILDVVKNIKKTKLLKIKDLKENKLCSCHDFDVSTYLQLLETTGQIKEVKIIGIPQRGNKAQIIKEIKRLVKKD